MGSIYSDWGLSRNKVGECEDGNIYRGWGLGRERIGQYEDGNIYSGWGLDRERIGEYEGNPAGAAAFLLLNLSGDSSSGDSDTGCLGSLFSLIGLLIMGLLKLLFYFYKFVFLYLVFPVWAAATVYYFGILIITVILGVLPDIVLVLGMIGRVLVLISLPYWVILFIQKKKRRMTGKETFKYYGKWFIKGPWAYKDIIELKNKPMSF